MTDSLTDPEKDVVDDGSPIGRTAAHETKNPNLSGAFLSIFRAEQNTGVKYPLLVWTGPAGTGFTAAPSECSRLIVTLREKLNKVQVMSNSMSVIITHSVELEKSARGRKEFAWKAEETSSALLTSVCRWRSALSMTYNRG